MHATKATACIDFYDNIISGKVSVFDLHLSESQRVMVAFPVSPIHTVSERRVVASQIETIQVGIMTSLVPPGTFVIHCT